MQLANLQQAFTGFIFDQAQSKSLQALVKSQGSLTAQQRLGIYRNSVRAALSQHLATLYPVTQMLVGKEFFDYLSEHYITQYPPTNAWLAQYGMQFAQLLKAMPALEKMPWLAEVARLEWARQHVWFSPNQSASDFSLLTNYLEQDQIRIIFYLPQSAQCLQSDYAIHAIWLAHQSEYSEQLELESIAVQEASYILIWRAQRRLLQVALTLIEWQFLSAIQQGKTLAELGLVFKESLEPLLVRAFQQGWIISFAAFEV